MYQDLKGNIRPLRVSGGQDRTMERGEICVFF
jgi:hypothetical protein